MLEALVSPLPNITVALHDAPVPVPGPNEVVIKVIVAASNEKDWAHPAALKIPSLNSGDDIAGIVYDLGTAVKATGDFHIGDRVAAFHQMLGPGGAYAEYALAPAHTTFIIPDRTSFEEAATIPLVSVTAAVTLFRRQGLPPPWSPLPPSAPPTPLIVYGAGAALGAFAVKLARLSNIHPIIAIGGASSKDLLPLLDAKRGDAFVDYRVGPEKMKAEVREALKGLKVRHAFDAISSRGTWVPISQLLDPESSSKLSVVSGANKYDEAEIPGGVEIIYTYVGTVHEGAYKPTMPKQPKDVDDVKNDIEFGAVWFRYVGRLLAQGKFQGHPFEVVPGGLRGVELGLRSIQSGAKGKKFVYRIEETDQI